MIQPGSTQHQPLSTVNVIGVKERPSETLSLLLQFLQRVQAYWRQKERESPLDCEWIAEEVRQHSRSILQGWLLQLNDEHIIWGVLQGLLEDVPWPEVKECLQAIISERADEETEIVIVIDHDAEQHWYGGHYADPKTQEISLENEQAYRQGGFREQGQHYQPVTPYAWAYRSSRYAATGLPATLRCWTPETPQGAESARGSASACLDAIPFLPLALFGREDWRQAFPGEPAVVTLRPKQTLRALTKTEQRKFDIRIAPKGYRLAIGPSRSDAIKGTPFRSRYHAQYQQYHQGRWPVYGGQLTVHLIEGGHPAAVTSTYLPVPEDRDFFPVVDVETAGQIAIEALRRYLEGEGGASRGWKAVAHSVEDGFESDAQKTLFVAPFGGDFHLVFDIWVNLGGDHNAFSVLVDAETGDVLGQPRHLTCYASAYASSSEAANPSPTGPTINQPLTANPCVSFMDIHTAGGGAVAWPRHEIAGPLFEASHVAIHAAKLYDRFRALGADPARLHDPARRLRTTVDVDLGNDLFMGLNPTNGQITFQRQSNADGLLAADAGGAALRVVRPTLDPEVVYHEIAHGLMWQLNRDPFVYNLSYAPFARALVEGYATYFGRAQTTPGQPNLGECWAIAAYPPAMWADRWALDRASGVPGADLAAVPGRFPGGHTDGLPVYDAGMIWARALWDLRQILGGDLVDRLALDAFMRATGTVGSFETIAEGLLQVADSQSHARVGTALRVLLATRTLLDWQGVRALAVSGGFVLAATNAGIMARQPAGVWQAELDDAGAALSDVVSLATAPNGAVYAATTSALYRRAPASIVWHKLAAWPATRRPTALAAGDGDVLFVGTGQGVWQGDAAANPPGWMKVNPAGFAQQAFNGPVLSLARGVDGAGEWLAAAAYGGLHVYRPGAGAGWVQPILPGVVAVKFTAVQARDDKLLIGTAGAGIWQGDWAGAGFTTIQIATLNDVGGGAVLSLAAAGPSALLAGTTSGLYEGSLVGGVWSWQHVNGSGIATAAITAITLLGGQPVAATALDGIWQQAGGAWALSHALHGADLGIVPRVGAGSAVYTVDAVPGQDPPLLCAHTFFLTQQARLRIALDIAPVSPPTLWSLRLNPVTAPMTKQGGANVWDSDGLHPPGFYAILARGAGFHTATISAV